MDNWQAGNVNLRPLVDGLIRLINPNVNLPLEVLGPVQLLKQLCEEADALRVRAADYHPNLVLLDAIREVAHADIVLLGTGKPAKYLALDAVIRDTVI